MISIEHFDGYSGREEWSNETLVHTHQGQCVNKVKKKGEEECVCDGAHRVRGIRRQRRCGRCGRCGMRSM